MMLDDVQPGLIYEFDHNEDNEMWLVTNVISRCEHTLTVEFMELALVGSYAGEHTSASFQGTASRHIGGRVIGRAGQ